MKGKDAMPQQMLPLIPRGATQINNLVSVYRDDDVDNDEWTYFVATQPIYNHKGEDQRMFRLITSQLIDSGCCRPIEVQKAFTVSKSSVMRWLKKLREDGAEAFFAKPRRGRRKGNVLTNLQSSSLKYKFL
jgi:DNA-binding transcriptional ArsR family regulator